MTIELIEQLEVTSPKTGPHTRILIIDDDEAMVDVLSRRLGQQGFETVAADCGAA